MVFSLIRGISLDSKRKKVVRKFILGIINNGLHRPELQGFLLDRRQVILLLPQIQSQGDHLEPGRRSGPDFYRKPCGAAPVGIKRDLLPSPRRVGQSE